MEISAGQTTVGYVKGFHRSILDEAIGASKLVLQGAVVGDLLHHHRHDQKLAQRVELDEI
ncbi:MAG: hypothetical protein AAF902_21540 [Chloroflexota bacterium]